MPDARALAEQTLAVICERLQDPAHCRAVAEAPQNQPRGAVGTGWTSVGLADGSPGVALMYAELARYDQRMLSIADRYIKDALNAQSHSSYAGLYLGPVATLSAVQSSTLRGARYVGVSRSLTAWAAQYQMKRVTHWLEQVEVGGGVSWDAYDVINGTAGVARILIDAPDDPLAIEAVQGTVDLLCRLVEERTVDGCSAPSWLTPNEYEPIEADRAQYAHGDLNLGLAHGAPGILAFLATAAGHGFASAPMIEAICALREQIMSCVCHDEVGPYWPARIPLELWSERPTVAFDQTRSAWCYGSPGVCVAILLADTVAPDAAARSTAISGLSSLSSRDFPSLGVDGATFCHGIAGLLGTSLHLRNHVPNYDAWSAGLIARLGTFVSEEHPFGVQHSLPATARERGGPKYRGVDCAGFLEGASGVACVLMDWLDGTMPSAGWGRVAMLS